MQTFVSFSDIAFISFMSDDFLRLLLLRFMFCAVALRMHRGFRSRNQLPRSSPPLPDDLLEHPTLVHIVMDLALHLQVTCILFICAKIKTIVFLISLTAADAGRTFRLIISLPNNINNILRSVLFP